MVSDGTNEINLMPSEWLIYFKIGRKYEKALNAVKNILTIIFLNYKAHVLFTENYRLQETYENHLIIKLVSVSVFFFLITSLKLS